MSDPMTPAVPDPTVEALSEADSNDPVWPHMGDPIDRWECDGCGAVVADCGGDEMLGWSGTEAGWFCPRCAQGELGEPPQAVKNRLHMMKGPHNNAKGILAALAARAAAPDALRVAVEALAIKDSERADASSLFGQGYDAGWNACIDLVRALLDDPALAGRATGGQG